MIAMNKLLIDLLHFQQKMQNDRTCMLHVIYHHREIMPDIHVDSSKHELVPPLVISNICATNDTDVKRELMKTLKFIYHSALRS